MNVTKLKPDELPIHVGQQVIDAAKRWIDRGDVVLCFQNMEIGNPNCGHFVFMPGEGRDDLQSMLGGRMPDTKTTIGWRYRLVHVTTDMTDFKYEAALDQWVAS